MPLFLGLTMLLAACALRLRGRCQDRFAQLLPGAHKSPSEAPAAAAATPKANAAPALIQRKIIYDARIDLLVKSLDATERAVLELIKDHNGFLAESNIAAQTGTHARCDLAGPRSGRPF